MSVAAILAPLFLQVLLLIILSVLLAVRRYKAAKTGEVKSTARVGDKLAWPKPALLASNSFQNQFEFPPLFFVLTILVLVTTKADLLFVIMAWIFVVSRYVHAFVHVTTNYVPYRAGAFGVGVTVLVIMWIIFAIRIMSGG